VDHEVKDKNILDNQLNIGVLEQLYTLFFLLYSSTIDIEYSKILYVILNNIYKREYPFSLSNLRH